MVATLAVLSVGVPGNGVAKGSVAKGPACLESMLLLVPSLVEKTSESQGFVDPNDEFSIYVYMIYSICYVPYSIFLVDLTSDSETSKSR